MAKAPIYGTNGADTMSFQSWLYDNSAIYGLGGPDIIQLNDVFSSDVYGGAGSDIIQSVFGYGNTLNGGAGQDLFFSKGDNNLRVIDKQGSSGVNFNQVTDAKVVLGSGDDTVIDKAGSGNNYTMGGGNDTVTMQDSAGGNVIKFGDFGDSKMTFDWTNGGAWSSDGPMFISPGAADKVVTGDGREMILVQAPYAYQNASGSAEINIVGFNAAEDGFRFDGGNAPTFVTVDGGDATGVYLGADGISIFSVTAHGVGWSVPDGVTNGAQFYGIGNIYGNQPEKGAGTLFSSEGGGHAYI